MTHPKHNKKIHFVLILALVLIGAFGGYRLVLAVGGQGTATIDGAANVNVVQATSHKFTVVLSIGESGITANAQNPTFTIPTGFTAPDAAPVANAGLVVADGDWSVSAAGGICTVDNPAVGLTAASGQVITVDVTTTCTVAVPDTITLTYQGQSASTMAATALVIKTADDIGWGAVTAIPSEPTITVTAGSATLNVIKHLVNNNGGTANAGNWTLTVSSSNGGTGTGSAVGVASPGTAYILQVDKAYSVAESGGPSGYGSGSSSDCTIASAVASATYTCTITNDDTGPQLTVTKTVINDSGGTKAVSDFPLFIDGFSVTSGVASTTSAGVHTVSETLDAGYTSTIGGDCAANGTVTLTLGVNKTCTIVNDDIAPSRSPRRVGTVTVIKVVVNDSGRNKTIADFPLFIDRVPVTSGVANSYIEPRGFFVVTETFDPRYYSRVFSGDCDVNGHVNLFYGEDKVCIITNDDIGATVVPAVPPLIDVVKVPSPLALPLGPGPVAYTYTLRNVGTVPVADVTMVGDTCIPIVFASGDTNGNGKLDVPETWVYRCTTTLSETHTNIVTATGWANGISAVDIASATVVVGAPIVPPLIHITKVPSPLALSASGGIVIYTKHVTNPGTVPLSFVRVTDDKCSPVAYSSGDTNGDGLLDTTETWVYTCQSYLSRTTTNTTVALGNANGLTARDVAVTTVVVASVKFPQTGIDPDQTRIAPCIALLAGGCILALLAFRAVSKKQTP